MNIANRFTSGFLILWLCCGFPFLWGKTVIEDNFDADDGWHQTLLNTKEGSVQYDHSREGLLLKGIEPLEDKPYTSFGLSKSFSPVDDFNFQTEVSIQQKDRTVMPMIKVLLYSKGDIVLSMNYEDKSRAGYGVQRTYSPLAGWNKVDSEPAGSLRGVWEADRKNGQLQVWWDGELMMTLEDSRPVDSIRIYMQGYYMASARWPWKWETGSYLAIHSLKLTDHSEKKHKKSQALQLSSIFSDGMVIQQQKPVKLWGRGTPGQQVEAIFGNERARGKVEADGTFSIVLPAFSASSESRELKIISAREEVVVNDVLVGEVWVMSGQSNMEWWLGYTKAIDHLQEYENDQLRFFSVKHVVADEKVTDPESRWLKANPDTLGDLSATSFHFAQEIHKHTGVPVGMVVAAWGGTRIETWTPMEVLESKYPGLLERWRNDLENYDSKTMSYQMNPELAYHNPAALYNGLIHPIATLSIRGFCWDQGGSNSSRAKQYASLLPDMIKAWRKTWQDNSLPFLVIQLPNYGKRATSPLPTDRGELRYAQSSALSLERTGLIVTMDIGDPANLHPDNKPEVARRLFLVADDMLRLNRDGLIFPTYKEATFNGNKAKITFLSRSGELYLKGSNPEKSLYIAGENQVFHFADKITCEGNKVIVSSSKVSTPVAVRYGWDTNPHAVLFDKQNDLPVGPFRSDDWEWSTAGKE